MSNENQKLSRKELSALITKLRGDEVSVDMVRKNEKRWGLMKSRGRDLNKRVIRYDEALARIALGNAGVI